MRVFNPFGMIHRREINVRLPYTATQIRVIAEFVGAWLTIGDTSIMKKLVLDAFDYRYGMFLDRLYHYRLDPYTNVHELAISYLDDLVGLVVFRPKPAGPDAYSKDCFHR